MKSIRCKYLFFSILNCKYKIIFIFALSFIGKYFNECTTYISEIVIGCIAITIAAIFWSVIDSYKSCLKARTKIISHVRILLNNINYKNTKSADDVVINAKNHVTEFENVHINICALSEDLSYNADFKKLSFALEKIISSLREQAKMLP